MTSGAATGAASPPSASAAALPAPSAPKQVIIIGAGVSGLSCAHHLLASPLNVNVVVLEARHRIGGRIFTHWLSATDQDAPFPDASDPTNKLPAPPASASSTRQPASSGPVSHSFQALSSGQVDPPRSNPDGTPRLSVDVGASILHGCGDDNQLVFRRAIEDRIRAPIVAGGGFYESTEHALWYDDQTGHRLSSDAIVEAHHIFFMASRYTASVASCCDDGAATLESVFTCGVNYVREHLPSCAFVCPSIQETLLKKIAARSMGYCAPMSKMALMQASAGMEVTGVDAIIGVPHEEDDPPFPGEVPCISPAAIRQQALKYDRSIIASQHPQRHTIASRRGGPGDRIVLDGYTPFLIDHLAQDVDIRLGQSVCAVSKGFRAPPNPSASPTADPPVCSKESEPKATTTATVPTNGGSAVGEVQIASETAKTSATTSATEAQSADVNTSTPTSTTSNQKRERSSGVDSDNVVGMVKNDLGKVKIENKNASGDGASKVDEKNADGEGVPKSNTTVNNSATNGNGSNCSPPSASSWDADPEVQTRTILVSTRDGEIFHGDLVVVTAPLGVLQGHDERSHISFSPELSENKTEAIHGMGMGVHNKIVLRFNEADVFWPPHVPQLNCLDVRFQMFNLHAYGKKGVLLVHVFAESGFAKGYERLSDEGVLAEVLITLAGMFCPKEDEADFDEGMKVDDEDDDDNDDVMEEATGEKPEDDENPSMVEEVKDVDVKDVTEDEQKALKREKKRQEKCKQKEVIRSKMSKSRGARKEIARKNLYAKLGVSPQCNPSVDGEKSSAPAIEAAQGDASEAKAEGKNEMEVDSEKTEPTVYTADSSKEGMKSGVQKQEAIEDRGAAVMKDETKVEVAKEKDDKCDVHDVNASDKANATDNQSKADAQPDTDATSDADKAKGGDKTKDDGKSTPTVPQPEEKQTKQTRSVTSGAAAPEPVNNDSGVTSGPRRIDWDDIPLPEEYVVTRWDEDPYALGSYSYMPCGSNWTVIDEMATPEPRESAHPYLFFAGEHCSDLGWQCVHGAYETGMRAAQDIVKCVGGDAMVARAFNTATGADAVNSVDANASINGNVGVVGVVKDDENVNMMNMQLENDGNMNMNFMNINTTINQQGIPIANAGFDSMGMPIAVDPNAGAAGVPHQYYQTVVHPVGAVNVDPAAAASHPVAMDIEQVHAQHQAIQQQAHIGAMPHAANVHIAHLQQQQQHGQIPVQLAPSMDMAEHRQISVPVAGIAGVMPVANATAATLGVAVGGTTEDFVQQARQEQQELIQQQAAQFQFQQQQQINNEAVMPGAVSVVGGNVVNIGVVGTGGRTPGAGVAVTGAGSAGRGTPGAASSSKRKPRDMRGSGRGSNSPAAVSGQSQQSNGENKGGGECAIWKDEFWTTERERALTRALIGYSDVYGNVDDIIDEISFALQTFKKEATDLGRAEIIQLVRKRIGQRVVEGDAEAKAFVKFHKPARETLFLDDASGNGMVKLDDGDGNDEDQENDRSERFAAPFEVMNGRARLIGLNGSKLKELYAGDIVEALTKYARPVADNQISFRETLRKIAVMIYRKDGGLMTKRCLSEYLRTQEFGSGPQKELYLEKYIPGGAAAYTATNSATNTK